MNTLACVLQSNNPMHVLVFKHAVKQSKTVYLQFTVTVHARVAETLVARAHTALNWPSHPLWMAIKDKRNSFFFADTSAKSATHTCTVIMATLYQCTLRPHASSKMRCFGFVVWIRVGSIK